MVVHGSGAVSAMAGAGRRGPRCIRRIAAAVLVALAAAVAFDAPSAVAQHTLVTATATKTMTPNASGTPRDIGKFSISGELGDREFQIRNTVGSAHFSRFSLGSIRLNSGTLTLLIADHNNVSGSPSQLQHYNPLRDLTLRLGGVDYSFSSASQRKQSGDPRILIEEVDPVAGSNFTNSTLRGVFATGTPAGLPTGTVHRYRWTASQTIGIGVEQAVTLKVPNTYPTMFGSHDERSLTRNPAEWQHDDANGWAVRNIGEPIYAQDREHGSVLTYSIENLRANTGRTGSDRSRWYRPCRLGAACADGVFAIDSGTGQIKTVSGKRYGLTTYRVLARVTDSSGASVGQYVTIRLSRNIFTPRARLTSAEIGSGGDEVSLNFNRRLDSERPSLGAFRVTVIGEDGEGNPVIVSTPRIGGVEVDGADKRVRLTGISPAIEGGQVVRVLYSARSWIPDTPIRDTSGNEAHPVLNVLVTNSLTSTAHSPLTAAFGGAPESHVGPVGFTLQLTFADPVTAGADDIRGAITVTNGALTAVAPGGSENTLWNLTVTPSSTAAVTVTLAASPPCGEAGAICTADGRRVEAAVETTVRGAAPVRKGLRKERVSEAHTLSIADAAAAEGGSLAFAVTLAPAAGDEVTVDWATADGPSPDGAVAGSDYTAGSGTLTFEAGETSKTVSVAVLDDSADEISETLTLTLSNPSGAGIGDGEAAGTLADNDGPAPLTAIFANVPAAHDGSGAISLRIGLDAALSTSWKGVRHSLAIANGALTRIHRIDGRSDLWGIDVAPAGDGDVTVRLNPSADCADPATTMCSSGGRRIETALSTVIPGPATVDLADPADNDGPAPLTATFANVPAAHDGSGAISLRIGLDAALSTSWKGVRHSLAIANGTLTRIHRIDGRSDLWGIDVAPAGDGDVTVRLNPSADCADPATTMCAAGGRRIETAVSTVIPGPAPVDTPVDTTAPLTARFVNMPSGHDSGSFAFRILFSEPISTGWKTMRDSSVRVTQDGRTGGAAGARRVDGRNDLWEVTVDPASRADIEIGLGPTAACADTGAVCTGGGKALSGGLQASVVGLPGLSVADARVREAANATVDFAVTMSRAATATVTVDYATSDGTATAGADYRAATGTLTFVSGETAKTVSVAVIEDDHDEGEETLTLTLSNVSGGNAWLKDATATGAIENTDAMPQAWLARFGRTVAGQVVDAVESRFAAARQPGMAVNLAGQALPRWSAGGTDAGARERLAAFPDRLGGRQDGAAGAGYGSRALTERDLLTGTSFSLTARAGDAGGLVSLWGRGAVSRFDGRGGGLSLDGEVASAMLGTDWTGGSGPGAWTAGLLLSHSRGEGGYRGASEGTVSSTVTGLYPYGRFMVNPRVTLWGVAGYGAGTLTLTPKTAEADVKDSPIRTDMALTMAAAGVRGVAFAAPAEGGFELAVTSDAMVARSSSEKTAGLVAAEAGAIRLRLGLEGSWRGIALGGGELTPRLETAMRHDGGDAETGFGLDLGGGLAWSHPASGISADLSGRGLLTHEAGGFRERGLSGSFAWDPGQGSGLGPKLALTQTLGASAAGGMDALLGRESLAGLAANDTGEDELQQRRLELKLGYGFPAFGDRFTSTPELGLGLSNGRREYSLGWRLNRVQGPAALELRLEATRREETNDSEDPVHGIGSRLTARF